MIPQAWRDTGIWLAIAGLAVVPILRVRFPLFDSTISLKSLVGLLEVAFVMAVFSRCRPVAIKPLPSHARLMACTLAAWLAWALAATALSDHQAVSLVRQVEWIVHGLFFYAVYSCILERRIHAHWILRIVIAGFILYFIEFSIFRWTLPWSDQEHSWASGIPGFDNVRHLGHYATVLLPLSLGLAITGSRRSDHILAALGMTISWMFIIWCGGRAPALGLIGGALIVSILSPTPGYGRIVKWLVPTSLSGGLLAALYAAPGLGLGNIIIRLTGAETIARLSSGRIALWQHSLDLVRDSPWFGLGPDGYLFRPLEGTWHLLHPHSMPLQIALEWGIPGLLLFAAFTTSVTIRWIRKAPSGEGGQYHWAVSWALLSLATVSLIDGIFYFPNTMVLVALCAGFVAASSSSNGIESRIHRAPLIIALTCGVLMAAHASSVALAVRNPPDPLHGVQTLEVVPTGLTDFRAVIAMRNRLVTCLHHDPSNCHQLAALAGSHLRPPYNSSFRDAAYLMAEGGHELAMCSLMEAIPWPIRDSGAIHERCRP